jgi:hypothetical protein
MTSPVLGNSLRVRASQRKAQGAPKIYFGFVPLRAQHTVLLSTKAFPEILRAMQKRTIRWDEVLMLTVEPRRIRLILNGTQVEIAFESGHELSELLRAWAADEEGAVDLPANAQFERLETLSDSSPPLREARFGAGPSLYGK